MASQPGDRQGDRQPGPDYPASLIEAHHVEEHLAEAQDAEDAGHDAGGQLDVSARQAVVIVGAGDAEPGDARRSQPGHDHDQAEPVDAPGTEQDAEQGDDRRRQAGADDEARRGVHQMPRREGRVGGARLAIHRSDVDAQSDPFPDAAADGRVIATHCEPISHGTPRRGR